MAIKPVTGNQRIQYLDILRGIAILFIFVANVTFFSGYFFYPEDLAQQVDLSGMDSLVEDLSLVLVDGKFYSIFSILFGIGFAIQYRNAKRSGTNFPSFFSKRMVGLLLIGIIHLWFFWIGDILTLYALLGFVLILFRDWSDRNLLIAAGVLLILPIFHSLFMYLTGAFYPYAFFGMVTQYWVENDFPLRDWSGSGFPSFDPLYQIQETDFKSFLTMKLFDAPVRLALILSEGRIFKVLALFIIGYWSGKQIFGFQLLDDVRRLKRILFWGVVIGIPFNLFRLYSGEQTGPVWTLVGNVSYAFGVVPLACGYAAGIALLVRKGSSFLSLFAPVGRMALTNYLMQTVLAITLFYGIGIGLSGKVGLTISVLISIVIFCFQVIFSKLWLQKFRYGPMEYLWRKMTYGRILSPRINKGNKAAA